jgi:RNA recognition motif-containing protein
VAGRILVGNLSECVKQSELLELFQQCGPVQSVDLATHPTKGTGKGFAFVELDTTANAERAIAQLEGTVLQGRKITLNLCDSKDDDSFLSRVFKILQAPARQEPRR